MRVLVINPNSTEAMTAGIERTAQHAAAPDLTVDACTNIHGPPAIQGEADGDAATPGVLSYVRQAEADAYDAAIIACFDDTGLAAARAAVGIPVLGIGQSSFLLASLYGPFSVITTLPVSVPVIEANIDGFGLGGLCKRVHASGLPVLSLEEDPQAAEDRLSQCAEEATADGSNALVLGCAGMAPFGTAMQAASGLPAIDGIAAAVGLARTAIVAARPFA